ACSHAATQGCIWTEVRRLARQHLSTLRERLLDFRQPRAGSRGEHKLAWLIVHDTAVASHVQDLALQAVTIKVLGSAAADAQTLALRCRLADALGEVGDGRLHRANP